MNWISETNIKGPKGDKGDKGDQGPPGTSGSGSGNVNGPTPPVVDNRIVTWSGTTATTIKDSGTLISDLAPVSNPVLTGDPRAPTPATADNDTSIATTAFVKAQGYATSASVPAPATVLPLIESGAGAIGTATKYAREDHVHPAGGGGDVTGPAGAVADRIAVFNGATGKIIKDGGVLVAGLQPTNQAVRYDAAQGLTAAQQLQARQNIYDAPFDAMASNGLHINGAMNISQELGTTGVTLASPASGYGLDGWNGGVIGAAGRTIVFSQTAISTLAGYSYALSVSCTVANAAQVAGDSQLVYQPIEGFRWARLAYGIASAQPVTIGFWIYPAAAGNIAVSLRNSALDRSYVVDVPVTAGSWQYKTITIPGCIDGTWLTNNGVGAYLTFSLGAGATYRTPTPGAWVSGAPGFTATASTTNFLAATGAYFITGVTVFPSSEAPSAARAAFVVPDYISELAACKRYWQKLGGTVLFDAIINAGYAPSAGSAVGPAVHYGQEMRGVPTLTFVGTWTYTNASAINPFPGVRSAYFGITSSAAGAAYYYNSAGSYIALNARL